MTSLQRPGETMQAPGLTRRMACFVYESMLLFGVVVMAGYLYSALTQQRHALHGQNGLRAFLFIVIGIYFIWFWSRTGQTLAMKTWHIRLVTAQGRLVSQPRAAARYLASWVWVLPALFVAGWGGIGSGLQVAGLLSGSVAVYALSSLLLPSRQFAHDLVCGTRLVHAARSGEPDAHAGLGQNRADEG
ncbi:MAG: RDD family protein [Rubrivivax sp.]